MGRQGVVVTTQPPPAVQSPPAMPPMPPKPPKKRYLMENPPRLQRTEMPSQQQPQAPPPASMVPAHHTLAGVYPAPTNGSNGLRHHQYPAGYSLPEDMQPLNLSTGTTSEMQLSRIVDRVVEVMLKKGEMDSTRAGDPLRLWFTNQFENKQRNESSSSAASSPSPRQKSASPQLPSPASTTVLAAASPEKLPPPPPGVVAPSPPARPPSTDSSSGASAAAADTALMHLTMSDTINRVIDNVYRRDESSVAAPAASSKRCEVSSCSSDCVNSTTAAEPSGPPPAPSTSAAPAPTATAAVAERRPDRTKGRKVAAATVLVSDSVPAPSPPRPVRNPGAPAQHTRTVGELPGATPGSDDDGDSTSGLVIDEHRVAGSETASETVDTSDGRGDERPPPAATADLDSPKRRGRKRNAPSGDGRSPEPASAAAAGRGSRKRKVGKEEIVRIQKDDNNGLNGMPSGVTKSKSQPK